MLLEPTRVVLNSLPVAVIPIPAAAVKPMIFVVAAAGDCDGLGWKSTVPAFGLLLANWWIDWRLPGVAALRSYDYITNEIFDLKGIMKEFTWSCVTFVILLPVTRSTSCENGDSDGDGCKRGLAEIEGDGLGVKNGPGGVNIPATKGK